MIGKSAPIELLSQVLDAAAVRHQVIAQNLANVNTPNYHRREVVFERELEKALDGRDGAVSIKPKIFESTGVPERIDGNTVDIDVETNLLEQNHLLMTAATQILTVKLAQMRSAIAGR